MPEPTRTVNDDGFVERPQVVNKHGVLQPGSIAWRLIETAANGKAIVVKSRNLATGAIMATMRKRGLKIHTAARDGVIYAWAEKVQEPAPHA